MITLGPDEKAENLLRNTLRILQSSKLPKFGLEGVLLANFPAVQDGMAICDLCTGTGIVPLLLTSRARNLRITGIEIQGPLVELARRSVELNNLGGQITIMAGDIRSYGLGKEAFDLVTVNPPFFPVAAGKVSPHSAKALARTEVGLTIDEVVAVADGLLKNKGRLALVYRASGLAEALKALKERRMGVSRIRFVHHNVQSKASSFLLECYKGKQAEILVEPPLFIYKLTGELTPEMHGVYFAGKALEGKVK